MFIFNEVHVKGRLYLASMKWYENEKNVEHQDVNIESVVAQLNLIFIYKTLLSLHLHSETNLNTITH